MKAECAYSGCPNDGVEKFQTGWAKPEGNGSEFELVAVNFLLCKEHSRLVESGPSHFSVEAKVVPNKTLPKIPISQLTQPLANRIYAEVCDVISPYESRGYNSHQRAQSICEEVKSQVADWLAKQNDERLHDDRHKA